LLEPREEGAGIRGGSCYAFFKISKKRLVVFGMKSVPLSKTRGGRFPSPTKKEKGALLTLGGGKGGGW